MCVSSAIFTMGSVRPGRAVDRRGAVEVGLLAQRDLDAVAALHRLQAGGAYHGGGVAVPRRRPGGLAPGGGDDPLLELRVVGPDEPLAPVLGHAAPVLPVLLDDDRVGLREL